MASLALQVWLNEGNDVDCFEIDEPDLVEYLNRSFPDRRREILARATEVDHDLYSVVSEGGVKPWRQRVTGRAGVVGRTPEG